MIFPPKMTVLKIKARNQQSLCACTGLEELIFFPGCSGNCDRMLLIRGFKKMAIVKRGLRHAGFAKAGSAKAL